MTTALTAGQVYELTLAQIASESFLDIAGPTYQPGDNLERVLKLGSNNPAKFFNTGDEVRVDLPGKTRMTSQQIEDFNVKYQIVAHLPNTWSGLSATLFQDRSTGTYTLSFRSTEFGDDTAGGDWSRDGITGADGELNSHGFAIAQVAEAEAWFRELRGQRPGAGGGLSKLLPDNAILNVTGYSLALPSRKGTENRQTALSFMA